MAPDPVEDRTPDLFRMVVTTVRPRASVQREVLVCACVDLAIGLRPYTASMS